MNKEVRNQAKVIIPKTKAKIRSLEQELSTVVNRVGEEWDMPSSDDEIKLRAAAITERIAILEKQRARTNLTFSKTKNHLEGETISKYWSGLAKSKKLRQTIHRLKTTNAEPTESQHAPRYEKCSKRMANMAAEYHNDIQFERTPSSPIDQEEAIARSLEEVTTMLSEQQKNEM